MVLSEIIWTIVLALSFIAFFGIASIVTIKGLSDFKGLILHLSKFENSLGE